MRLKVTAKNRKYNNVAKALESLLNDTIDVEATYEAVVSDLLLYGYTTPKAVKLSHIIRRK